MVGLHRGEQILRARWHRSHKTRRDWVHYVHDVEALRAMEDKIARGENLI